MLPLVSKTRPTATGSSSMANCVIGCGTLSSKTRKFSFSRPETGRFSGSLTVTGTRIRVVSTRILARPGASCFEAGLGGGSILTWPASVPARHIFSPNTQHRMSNGPLDGIVHSGGGANPNGNMTSTQRRRERRDKRREEQSKANPENVGTYFEVHLDELVFVFSALISASLR